MPANGTRGTLFRASESSTRPMRRSARWEFWPGSSSLAVYALTVFDPGIPHSAVVNLFDRVRARNGTERWWRLHRCPSVVVTIHRFAMAIDEQAMDRTAKLIRATSAVVGRHRLSMTRRPAVDDSVTSKLGGARGQMAPDGQSRPSMS